MFSLGTKDNLVILDEHIRFFGLFFTLLAEDKEKKV